MFGNEGVSGMKVLSRWLQLWMSWVLTRPRLVLGVAMTVALASAALSATRLEMVTDQLELISEKHPLITLNDRLDPFRSGGMSGFCVVIQAPTPDQAVSFLQSYPQGLRKIAPTSGTSLIGLIRSLSSRGNCCIWTSRNWSISRRRSMKIFDWWKGLPKLPSC